MPDRSGAVAVPRALHPADGAAVGVDAAAVFRVPGRTVALIVNVSHPVPSE